MSLIEPSISDQEGGARAELSATEPTIAPIPSRISALLPVMGFVFVAYLIMGLAMPVLPLHVHRGFGLSTFVVGLVSGSQFAAAILTRPWAGHFGDTRGA